MSRVQKTMLTTAILIVLQYAANANASVYLECKDDSRSNCEEISKGKAVRVAVTNPEKVILKVDRLKLDEETGSLKAKKN